MEHTPKHVALQIGTFICLYVSLSAFLILIFGIINLSFPDAAESYWEVDGNQSGIRYAIAALIVFFPTYVWLTRSVNQARRTASTLYHSLTKWIVYLSLLVGGLIILGDFVMVILTFLDGELTTRFILKSLSLTAVIGAAFWYYWNDAKDYWNSHEKESIRIGIGISIVVVISLVYGYTLIDSPQTVREVRLDEQQLTDLQDIQWHIEAYYVREQMLPTTIDEAYDDVAVPTAPDTRPDYTFNPTGDRSYELCATFSAASPESQRSIAKPMADANYNPNNYNWEHGVGEKCFARTITAVTE